MPPLRRGPGRGPGGRKERGGGRKPPYPSAIPAGARVRGAATTPSRGHWDRAVEEALRGPALGAWREYMRRVYARLIREWLPPPGGGPTLKTDLFEEAVTSRHPAADLGRGLVGIDGSEAVARAARNRRGGGPGGLRPVVADLRQLPFRSGGVARVLSGSSLDHFGSRSELAAALAELARVLAPGGVMVLTFDNPHNPVIRLRNLLPFPWLRRAGLVPYYVGVTPTRREALRRFEELGLAATRIEPVAHVPRAPAVALSALVERAAGTRGDRLLVRAFEALERLGLLPTRLRTGYYLAFRVVKRSPRPARARRRSPG